jgi:GNAT superfamily N-acetyltransferase
VAVLNEAIAGFVLVVDDEVEQVYVAANHRGTGIAGALMREAERRVRANGHARGWLAVVAGNARARAFYERSGWHNEGPFVYEAVAGEGTVGVPSLRYVKDV